MKNQSKKDIVAEVMFISTSGKDPKTILITRENISSFLLDSVSIKIVKEYFQRKNVQFQYYQGISATILANRKIIENVFGIKLGTKNGHFYVRNSDNELNLPLNNLPMEIANKISFITLQEPIQLH